MMIGSIVVTSEWFLLSIALCTAVTIYPLGHFILISNTGDFLIQDVRTLHAPVVYSLRIIYFTRFRRFLAITSRAFVAACTQSFASIQSPHTAGTF